MKVDSKQNKSKRKKNKISFDEEVISKEQAEKLLSEQVVYPIPKAQILERKGDSQFKTTEKNKKRKLHNIKPTNIEKSKPKKTRASNNQAIENNTVPLKETHPTQEPHIPNQPKKESVRAQKRKKHAKLLEQKKLDAEHELQQKTLNYLSKWKHSRLEWKFEKLKQVWIQQNMFDTSKIPDEFWETTVEYFSGAKGHSRQVALDEALKIVEKEEESVEGNLDDDYQGKLKRARNIVQYLQ